jgi:twitching motility protein PilT
VPLLDSLLTAIVRANGDALVLHVGEKPYVVTAAGPVEISSRPLAADALTAMLAELLPFEDRLALDEVGAIERPLPEHPAAPGGQFTVVAARGGEDIWIEIRRRPPSEELPSPGAGRAAAPPVALAGDEAFGPPDVPEDETPSRSVAPPPAPGDSRAGRAETRTPARPIQPAPEALPLPRAPVRSDHQTRGLTSPRLAGLDRLLRLAAARGASTLYLVANSRPSIRVEGEIAVLEGEMPLGPTEVESLILELAPERSRQALRSGEGAEWIVDVPEVGRVRCMSFRDHRGPGGIFRLIPAKAISAEQLGLSREIQGLCAEPEGLVLVAGPRASGKSTLLSALVDLINRTRSEHIITLESEIKFVHESRTSLISQREVRGDLGELVAAGRAALRENPDVLVVEDLRWPEIVALVLEAAEAGRLVIGALTAHTAATAVGRFLDMFPADRRTQAQVTLAEALRGVVVQVLLRKTGGGRVAARELLLNTPAVANLIAEGKIPQLPLALDSGRRYGMVPLNDSLVAFVQSGAVDAREAYRKAFDRQAFLALLKREGIDTSFVERLG